MPKKRLPRELWVERRKRVRERDGGVCQSPLPAPVCQGKPRLPARQGHCDHIRSGKQAGNEQSNLRTLCRVCHVLRADPRHRGMLANALRDGILPEDWRDYIWDG